MASSRHAQDGDYQLLIGEVARRAGISPGLLRAWERRYGMLRPVRSAAGYRLYSREDAERVRAMVDMVEAGVAPNQAARALRSPPPEPAATSTDAAPGSERAALAAALDRYDEASAQTAFDRLLSTYSVPAILTGVVLPYLRDLGERWSRGEVTVSQEHFASNLIRGRLLGLARGWDAGGGPRAVLACPAGERHDIGLIAFGLALRAQGWRITYLGPDTPVESIADAAARLRPDALVLAVSAPERLTAIPASLAVPGMRLAVGGPGATSDHVGRLHALPLDRDPFRAAAQLAAAGSG
jgi:MerR family transcriptional regulator, light-induced transcriptional regulator